MGFGQEVKETVVLGAVAAKLFEVCFRITPLQPDQGWAGGLLLRHQGVFQAEPEQGLVLPRLFLMLEAAEERAQKRVVIVLAGEAEDAVPIDIGGPVGGVELEVRVEAVIRGGVPDQVTGALFLKVGNLLRHERKTSPRPALPSMRAEMMSLTS